MLLCSNSSFTRAGNLSHLNNDGVTELAEFSEGLHPAADVHFIFFSQVQAVDCLMRVSLNLQLKVTKTDERFLK